MDATRKDFTHDALLERVRKHFQRGLDLLKVPELLGSRFSNLDCLMSGLALFTFKFPSLLRFDESFSQDRPLKRNLTKLFKLDAVPCDTHMRTRLDVLSARIVRSAFTNLFSLLQRSRILDHFRFFGDYYLISLDGTGIFSSPTVHCENCCVKNHRNGSITYHHQMLLGALVHPGQKVVYPFAPEPIMKSDGDQKNDCERNAAKRWVADFRREHPHLKGIILGDGLFSNAPFIKLLQDNNLRFIVVAKELGHKYLTEWVNVAEAPEKPQLSETIKGITSTYEYMEKIPLNESALDLLVTVVRFTETKKGKTTKWMWATDLTVNLDNIRDFAKGARARWKIENETFNTLKNQGYEFEHNFGHGKKHLHTVFASLMVLAFFIDQTLQKVNKRFQEALERAGSRKELWNHMLYTVQRMTVPDFETIYHIRVHPPPIYIPSVI